VTGGTGKKVKINGKEVAVIGSMVTTCNDTGARNNSTIIAPGASIPMPVIINPKNMAEYELERAEQDKKEPAFTTVKWGKSKVKEGEETELSAQVKDIEDGNMVTFQIWKEGQDPASHIAMAQIVKDIAGGVAKARFSYTLPAGEKLPERDPKWFFTVHSAWCAWKQSGMIEVELKRPELSEAKWTDTDGKDTDKGLVGAAVKLGVTCNKDTEEGAGVTFKVYPDGSDPKRDQPVEEIASSNQGGKAEAEWTYRYKHDPENPLKEKPKFFFTAVGKRCQEVKSGTVEIGMDYHIFMEHNGEMLANVSCNVSLSDGTIENTVTDGEGFLDLNGKTPGVVLSIEHTNSQGEGKIIIPQEQKQPEQKE
jgi:SepF-like predicted cell division protein (DUF552 family)